MFIIVLPNLLFFFYIYMYIYTFEKSFMIYLSKFQSKINFQSNNQYIYIYICTILIFMKFQHYNSH